MLLKHNMRQLPNYRQSPGQVIVYPCKNATQRTSRNPVPGNAMHDTVTIR